jgi:uncharacterized membrane protein YsdA (DUF1294 family)
LPILGKLNRHCRKRNVVINLSILLGGVALYYKTVGLWALAFTLINLYGWSLFFLDKRKAAHQGKFRIPENTFFIVSLCGGGVGTYVGMLLHRHKTKHIRFKLIIPVLMFTSLVVFSYGFYYIFNTY